MYVLKWDDGKETPKVIVQNLKQYSKTVILFLKKVVIYFTPQNESVKKLANKMKYSSCSQFKKKIVINP